MLRLRPLSFLALAVSATQAGAQGSALQRTPSRFAMVDGARIHYKSLGTGRTAVVLVHGWACDLEVWQAQVPVLDGRVRVVALDLPGHGRSDKPVRDYSMAHAARAVAQVLEAAGVGSAVLVGHSMGVPVVREFLRLYPDKAKAFVAIDGALFAPGLDSAAIERQVAMFRAESAPRAFEQMIAPMFPSPAQAAIRRQITATAVATPIHVVQGSIRGMLDPAIWRNDRLTIPTLVVVAKGPQWPAGYRAKVEGLGSDVRYEEIDGVHHFLMLERPDLFNPLLLEFLNSLGLL